jgi:hypothetical protein
LDHELLLDKGRADFEIHESLDGFTITSGVEEYVFAPNNRAEFRHWLDTASNASEGENPAETSSQTPRPAEVSPDRNRRSCSNCGRTSADPAADFCAGCGKRLHLNPESAVLQSLVERVSRLERDASTSRPNIWRWQDVQSSEKWRVFWGILGRNLLVWLALLLVITVGLLATSSQ